MQETKKIDGTIRRELFLDTAEGRALMLRRRRELEAAGETWHRSMRVKRNDPCPCKSGTKFKKCCLLKHVRRK